MYFSCIAVYLWIRPSSDERPYCPRMNSGTFIVYHINDSSIPSIDVYLFLYFCIPRVFVFACICLKPCISRLITLFIRICLVYPDLYELLLIFGWCHIICSMRCVHDYGHKIIVYRRQFLMQFENNIQFVISILTTIMNANVIYDR